MEPTFRMSFGAQQEVDLTSNVGVPHVWVLNARGCDIARSPSGHGDQGLFMHKCRVPTAER